ncbi:MFS transporter [Herbiconiux daphne]|uniref:MFS transporter n=1 Tax=Herbiconiux daphne TaxID=2970914 RepID=A0ABT2H193_9MICO|nr:MFS transporter [Herbiconiux daphne]MCS5733699.1 MFS transporter [Herbiconiux daphne]
MTTIEQSYAHRLYSRLAILAVGLFVVATNAFVIAGLLPSIASTLGVQAADVSYSISYYAIVVAVAAPAISILFTRMSRTIFMATGMALVAVGTLIAALAPSLPVFTVGRLVAALGGAALVPAATAAAASLAPAARRGRAIAFVAVGFTAASAFGAPLGTALAAVGGWREPLLGLAGLAAIVAVAIALFVRRVPVGEPVSVRRRFSILADPRILLTLGAVLLLVCGFNAVYIFSSTVTAPVTGGSPSLLAFLLLVFGVAGIAGNVVAGRLTDRFGNRRVAGFFLALQLLSLALVPLFATSLAGTAVLFAVWGASANAATLPIQHRLIEIDPATSGIALSWYSTAMYAGIALAPPLGAAAVRIGGGELVPEFAAAAVVLALVVFQLGALARNGVGPRRPRDTNRENLATHAH